MIHTHTVSDHNWQTLMLKLKESLKLVLLLYFQEKNYWDDIYVIYLLISRKSNKTYLVVIEID